jgi:hypothetical protein
MSRSGEGPVKGLDWTFKAMVDGQVVDALLCQHRIPPAPNAERFAHDHYGSARLSARLPNPLSRSSVRRPRYSNNLTGETGQSPICERRFLCQTRILKIV